MVQRATCSSESNTSTDGVRISDRERGAVIPGIAAGDTGPEGTTLGRGGTARFSLFRWFKRGTGNRDSTIEKRRKTLGKSRSERRPSVTSSVESVDTFYSTTTVRSFAFHAGTLAGCEGGSLNVFHQAAEVGPFAAGAAKVRDKENNVLEAASTLPASALSRKRDLTARYSLQPSTGFNSCGNLPERRLSGSFKRLEERAGGKGSCNGSVRKRAHVKGKRRAPNPPGLARTETDAPRHGNSSNRRKRRAPKPPERIADPSTRETKPTDGGGMEVEARKEAEEGQTISNDTLVLQGGVLHSKKEVRQSVRASKDNGQLSEIVPQEGPTPQVPSIGTLGSAMPRPWYKRSVFEHSRDSGPSRRGDVLRGATSSSAEIKEECAGPSAVASSSSASSSSSYSIDASLSRLSFFHRAGQSEERKRDAKRKSGLSILTNISELDKEAAAIVQEEQARARASMLLKSSRFVDAFERRNEANEEIVQDIVTSAMENSSPRRGTRALISKFNAISNITKVTVNTNFFAKNAKEQQPPKFERDVVRNARLEHDWKEQLRFPGQGAQVERDISRFFPPQQRTSRSWMEATETEAKVPGTRIGSGKECSDQLAAETTSRISLLQSRLAANRMNEAATSQKDTAAAVIEEKIRSRQEVHGERKERETKPGGELAGRHFLSRPTLEKTEKESGETKKRERQRLDGVQREFSDIFDEIDRQLRTKEFKLDRRAGSSSADQKERMLDRKESETSSKVEKVLDILMEAEKDNRAKAMEKSIPAENTVQPMVPEAKTKSGKPRPLTEDPITTDLKEMLKEMKHSLPKRPKPKKNTEIGVQKQTERKTVEPSKTTYFVSAVTKVENIAVQGDYEPDKQKVSSSVQTSGNVRRLNQPTDRPSASGWRQENVVYRTSGRNMEGTGLVKNTFQLIRPREFAEIEAVKTTREPQKENTYANVIEQSLYANARVPPPSPSPKQRVEAARCKNVPRNTERPPSSPLAAKAKIVEKEETLGDTEEEDNAVDRNMNTLAINRLLRKLEAAIASGHHQQAAGLAKELARLKIHCSVIRQRSARLKDQLIKVNMYIEDKLAHQGPIPLQLPTTMTVAQLKAKIETEFEIPANVQRWIIGKNLADHDQATLAELQAVEGSAVFLYLVAPELKVENAVQVEKPSTEPPPKTNEEESTAAVQVLETVKENEEPIEELQETAERRTPDEVKMDRYEELISLENCDVIPNSEPIECPVCFVTYGPREGVILRDCLHMFCRSCLSNTIKYCEEAEVKCPYRDTEYTCESTLQEREIKALVEPEVYQQHLAKSIAQAENNAGNNAFHCKTPDCPGWCIYDDNVNNFLCPVCGANNCLTCQVIHAGKNCKQYQQELRLSKETDQESRRTAAMLEEMVDRGEALACPTCAVVLMKKWGCDWLRCSMCKTEICWVTRGPRWGPGGRGDTSGGCRCGENGVKCHPRCNYCH